MPFETVLSAGFETNGYYTVMRQDNKWNLVHKDILEPICEIWFDSVRSFYHGYAAVENDGKWNYIDVAGNILSEKWFSEVKDFGQKFGTVRDKKTWKYIDEEGELHGRYSTATSFKHGLASVSIRKKYYIINKDFEKIHGPFDYASNILIGNTAIVRDKDGQRIELL